jgi:hypothetical protein
MTPRKAVARVHEDGQVASARPRKRARLTHLEVRRGEALRLRIAIADDALAEVGDELGALLKKISPSSRAPTIVTPATTGLVVSREHTGDDATHTSGDVTFHADVREHLVELFSSLCDDSLADALEIARAESARRANGGN